MQLIPRYLYNNLTNVITSETGFVVEYRPVYSRQLKVYRGIDNTLQFRLLNADQKPVQISNQPVFVAFDESGNQVIERNCTVTDDSSNALKGMFEVTITENDLLNLQQQYLTYNIFLRDNNDRILTYTNRNFDSAGIIYLNSNSFPGVKDSKSVVNWYQTGNYYYATIDELGERLNAEPGLNGNNALHTIAVYPNGYTGDLVVQATLDTSTDTTQWATVTTLTFDGTETEPVPANFNGVYSYIRFKADDDTIEKILIRN